MPQSSPDRIYPGGWRARGMSDRDKKARLAWIEAEIDACSDTIRSLRAAQRAPPLRSFLDTSDEMISVRVDFISAAERVAFGDMLLYILVGLVKRGEKRLRDEIRETDFRTLAGDCESDIRGAIETFIDGYRKIDTEDLPMIDLSMPLSRDMFDTLFGYYSSSIWITKEIGGRANSMANVFLFMEMLILLSSIFNITDEQPVQDVLSTFRRYEKYVSRMGGVLVNGRSGCMPPYPDPSEWAIGREEGKVEDDLSALEGMIRSVSGLAPDFVREALCTTIMELDIGKTVERLEPCYHSPLILNLWCDSYVAALLFHPVMLSLYANMYNLHGTNAIDLVLDELKNMRNRFNETAKFRPMIATFVRIMGEYYRGNGRNKLTQVCKEVHGRIPDLYRKYFECESCAPSGGAGMVPD